MAPAKTDVPVPALAKRTLTWGSALLIVIAAVFNITHTQEHAGEFGQDQLRSWVIALLPDILLFLSVTRLIYHRRSVAGWVGVSVSGGFVAWSAVTTITDPSIDGWTKTGQCVVALFPIAVAGLATWLLHGAAGETLEEYKARTDGEVQSVKDAAARAVSDATAAAQRAVEDAETHAASVQENADAKVAQALADAQEAAARSAAVEAELETLQAVHQATVEAARSTPTAPRKARTAPGRPRSGNRPAARPESGGDLERRHVVKAAFLASAGTPEEWTKERLAAELYATGNPTDKEVDAARVNARNWKLAAGVATAKPAPTAAMEGAL